MSAATSIQALMTWGMSPQMANQFVNGLPFPLTLTIDAVVTTMTVESITGSDSSLGITGQAAAQGGAVAITGGASSTAANAGGATTMTGGAGGATGAGGVSRIQGGVGGATSGNGGQASVVGGAATTSGNGGAVGVTGGAGAATGAGGIITITGGASGAGATGNGGGANVIGGAAVSTNGAGGAVAATGGAGAGTGAGGAVSVTGGASGAGATGNGGAASLTAGAATSTNGSGGAVAIASGASTGTGAGASITLTPGAVSTGAAGAVIQRGLTVVRQGAPTAQTTSATLTAAALISGIITANEGATGAASYTLPTAADLQTALPSAFANDDAFDFSVINISTVAGEDATLLTAAGWTLVGSMVVESFDADRARSSGRFRARRTASNTFTLYRIA